MASVAPARPRPLSPHLSHWKWGIHMAVSILHRVTGHAMALVAVPILVWWLVAIASGETAYNRFYKLASDWPGYVFAIAFTWIFFQHLANGIRHLVMDAGAGFEIARNKRTSTATIMFSLLMTVALWGLVLARRGGF